MVSDFIDKKEPIPKIEVHARSFSRWLLLILGICVSIVGTATVAMGIRDSDNRVVLGGVMGLFCGSVMVIGAAIMFWFRNTPAFIFHGDGLELPGSRFGVLPWNSIVNAEVISIKDSLYLGMQLTEDGRAKIRRTYLYVKLSMWLMKIMRPGYDFIMPLADLEASPQMICEEIMARKAGTLGPLIELHEKRKK